jgi:hypothetical protein
MGHEAVFQVCTFFLFTLTCSSHPDVLLVTYGLLTVENVWLTTSIMEFDHHSASTTSPGSCAEISIKYF